MSGSNRRASSAILGVAIALVGVGGESVSRAQTRLGAPSYETRLLDQIDVSDQSRPGDLPELARLVLLETISMHQYAARELRGTPAGTALLDEIATLWDASAAFDRVVGAIKTGAPAGETPAQALADLEEAHARVRSDLGAGPGQARLAWYRLERVTRLLAEIRPRIGPGAAARASATTAGVPLSDLRDETRLLARNLDDLLVALGTSDLAGGVGQLLALVRGLDGLLAGRPTVEDVRAAFRPVRLRALQVDALVRSRVTPVEVRARWRAIREGIDRLSDRFELPRVIALAPASPATPPPAGAIATIDAAASNIDAFLAEIAPATVVLPDKARVEDEAHRLRTRLLRYRQDLLAGLPRARASTALSDLAGASRQLADRVRTTGGRLRDRDNARVREIDRLVNELARTAGAGGSG